MDLVQKNMELYRAEPRSWTNEVMERELRPIAPPNHGWRQLTNEELAVEQRVGGDVLKGTTVPFMYLIANGFRGAFVSPRGLYLGPGQSRASPAIA